MMMSGLHFKDEVPFHTVYACAGARRGRNVQIQGQCG